MYRGALALGSSVVVFPLVLGACGAAEHLEDANDLGVSQARLVLPPAVGAFPVTISGSDAETLMTLLAAAGLPPKVFPDGTQTFEVDSVLCQRGASPGALCELVANGVSHGCTAQEGETLFQYMKDHGALRGLGHARGIVASLEDIQCVPGGHSAEAECKVVVDRVKPGY